MVTKPPKFHFWPKDPGECLNCRDYLDYAKELPPADSSTPGVWRWEMTQVREGMTFLSWDVAREPRPQAPVPSSGIGS